MWDGRSEGVAELVQQFFDADQEFRLKKASVDLNEKSRRLKTCASHENLPRGIHPRGEKHDQQKTN